MILKQWREWTAHQREAVQHLLRKEQESLILRILESKILKGDLRIKRSGNQRLLVKA